MVATQNRTMEKKFTNLENFVFLIEDSVFKINKQVSNMDDLQENFDSMKVNIVDTNSQLHSIISLLHERG
jgi:phage-related protein